MKEESIKESPRSCSYLVALVLLSIAAFAILDIRNFFQQPQAMEKFRDYMIGLGGCCGILIFVFVLLFVIIPRLPKKSRQYRPGEEDEHDDYYDYF